MSTSKMSMLWCDVVAFCLCFIFAVVVGLTHGQLNQLEPL